MPTVCLAMIVRDEAHVLRRCLDSVRPVLDQWLVVDTGSSDGSQDVVRETLGAIPGELVERPWVDFGHNRTEALTLAATRADYVLVIDADEQLVIEPGFSAESLTADAYRLTSRYGSQQYARTHVMSSRLPWQYAGVVHEYAHCEGAGPAPLLSTLRVEVHHDGARSRDPQTYRRDALLLEASLLEDPDNDRTVFYLAQSYRDAGDLELALRHYRARLTMGGWPDEVWYARYQIARLRQAQGCEWGSVVADYLAAFESMPDRAEPLYRLGTHFSLLGNDQVAHLFLARAIAIPRPTHERLFVDADTYDHLLPLAYAEVSGRTGHHAEAIETCNRLLRAGTIPPERIGDAVACRRRSTLRGRPPLPHPRTERRIHVLVCAGQGHDAVDASLDTVERLEPPPYDVRVVDETGSPAMTDALARCAPSDVVIALPATSGFAGPDVLSRVGAMFDDPACALLYGQHRRDDGMLGDAEPAADEADFDARGEDLPSHSPLIFRAGLGAQVPDGDLASHRGALFRAAGFSGTRFTDDVLTVHQPAEPSPARHFAPSAAAGPLVSCLMVTRDRLNLAKRAIGCFANQAYPNRELVIVTDGTSRYGRLLEQYAQRMDARVQLVQVEDTGLSLGALRNASLEAASGEVVCQWDDDDCFHPDRVATQLDYMRSTRSRACLLTDHFQFLHDDQALVWVDWALGGKSGRDQLLPGTVMMYADARFRYPESGPFARRGEDTALLNSLCDQVPVAGLRGQGHLYLYTYHGSNTFDREHHHRMAIFSRPVAQLVSQRDHICSAMVHYPVPRPYLVIGRDGPAFMLND